MRREVFHVQVSDVTGSQSHCSFFLKRKLKTQVFVLLFPFGT